MNKQLQFNFKEPIPPSACKLKTKEISQLIGLVTRQEISVDEVRKRLKANDGFTVIYAHGRLRVIASKQRKQGKFLMADVEFLPAVVA